MSVKTSLLPDEEKQPLGKTSFASDQEVRWCPGCGDYAILASMQKVLPELGIARENMVFVSGIGCSSRFPYYLNTFGFHTIHGRAPAIATGLKMARPELSVWVITGDGDGLSIGTNHLLHLMRRNVDVTVLLFNNRIYGLTKGQFSPTSEKGKKTKTSPQGTLEEPFDPIQLALAAGCSFVARAIDVDAKGLQWVLKEAAQHRGTSFVEIYQNCNVFNDGAFSEISERALRSERTLLLQPGQPLVFGENNQKAIVLNQDNIEIVEVNEDTKSSLLVHQSDLPLATVTRLASLRYPDFPVPIGIFRALSRPVYEEEMAKQTASARSKHASPTLEGLLRTGKTWVVT